MAYETLKDEDKRKAYDKSLRPREDFDYFGDGFFNDPFGSSLFHRDTFGSNLFSRDPFFDDGLYRNLFSRDNDFFNQRDLFNRHLNNQFGSNNTHSYTKQTESFYKNGMKTTKIKTMENGHYTEQTIVEDSRGNIIRNTLQ